MITLFRHNKKARVLKKKIRLEFDARKYWVVLLCSFVTVLIGELLYFSTLFIKKMDKIDALATPTLETNAATIRTMNELLSKTEEAVSGRTGIPTVSSQNSLEVVQ